MSIVYCSANHSPEQLLSWMQKEFDLDASEDFTIVPFHKRLNPKKARSYKSRIILLCYSDMLRNYEFFSHAAFKNRQFFVFAPPYRCAELNNSVWLDFQNDSEMPGIAYQMLGWQRELYNPNVKATAKHEPVSKVNEGFQTKVINQIKSVGSIMSGLQTLVYTLPKRAMQKPVTYAFCNWMYEGGDEEDLNSIIEQLKYEVSLTKRKAERFKELMLGEDGQKAQQAFEIIREQRSAGKSADYKTVGKQVGIHAFDLRYIMRVVRSDEEYSDVEDVTVTEFYERTAAKEAARKAKMADNIQKAEESEERDATEDPEVIKKPKTRRRRGKTRGNKTTATRTRKRTH